VGQRVIVIVGPTCSGKSYLGLKLAQLINGEIISTDSRQIYKRLNIGTAKPALEELQKVKNQKLMEFYHTMETINGKANTIGNYELFFGDYKKLFSAPQDFAKVTAEDIQRVAAKYFTKKNRTVGILMAEEETK